MEPIRRNPRCDDCDFVQSYSNGNPVIKWMCCRYPEWIEVIKEHWCGEYAAPGTKFIPDGVE